MARKKQITPVHDISESERAKLIAEQSVRLAEYAAKVLIAAEQLQIKSA